PSRVRLDPLSPGLGVRQPVGWLNRARVTQSRSVHRAARCPCARSQGARLALSDHRRRTYEPAHRRKARLPPIDLRYRLYLAWMTRPAVVYTRTARQKMHAFCPGGPNLASGEPPALMSRSTS